MLALVAPENCIDQLKLILFWAIFLPYLKIKMWAGRTYIFGKSFFSTDFNNIINPLDGTAYNYNYEEPGVGSLEQSSFFKNSFFFSYDIITKLISKEKCSGLKNLGIIEFPLM